MDETVYIVSTVGLDSTQKAKRFVCASRDIT